MQLSQEELYASDQADFHPLYRCLHISEVMGIRDQIESYYKASVAHTLVDNIGPLFFGK